MSDWTWGCAGDANGSLNGLAEPLREEFQRIADRLVAAAEVRHPGHHDEPTSGITGMQTFGEGRWLISYMDYPRIREVVITRIQHL